MVQQRLLIWVIHTSLCYVMNPILACCTWDFSEIRENRLYSGQKPLSDRLCGFGGVVLKRSLVSDFRRVRIDCRREVISNGLAKTDLKGGIR
jgi:hypothetical protein